ncbi:MAG TPA: hypothetical protein VFI25_09625 [Planctomycetota bacterium]|jgi:hypothetical protein|nr:hypothetical protein [Planctomycetota bacterium]
MRESSDGRRNVVVGFAALLGFLLYGFFLLYQRDFSAARREWIAGFAEGEAFESRLAHAHGNLLAILNVLVGLFLERLGRSTRATRAASWCALAGLGMPVGIAAEAHLGAPPILVLAGGAAMAVSVAICLGLAARAERAQRS